VSLETFDAAWLALREPVDHRSREDALAARLAKWWAAGDRSSVLDLGCGTGSNLRYLAPRLRGRQHWTLVDHDPRLLARIAAPSGDLIVELVPANLTEGALERVAGTDLVTASALLDLVSRKWLDELVAACARAGAGALFALSYDGTIEWGSSLADDALVRDAVNAHQARDKGFGPALGPAAARVVEDTFRRRGYRTWSAPTPWRLEAADAELARRLVSGWANAAAEQRPDVADAVRSWAARRAEMVGQADFALTVGHVDLLALPRPSTATRARP
jgi:SAM-dependent methyltransferase